MKTAKNQNKISRRRFLGGTAFSAATFMILPGSVLGVRGGTSANGKLNLAGIGIGGRGSDDLGALAGSENIVALCDVDQNYAAPVFKKYPDAKRFTDFRRMLDEMKEIDGVVIATPDHLHAFATMEAVQRGKHVYCEKPLTHSVWEAHRVAEAARTAKVATQMGNGGQASEETRRLCELVWSGIIGPVREAHIWTDRPSQGLFNEYWPQGIGRPKDEPPVPATLDWDLWLGPAPQRPYNPAYLPFKWRGWWDFGTGALGDIGCHAMDPVFRALKLGAPNSVQASSTRVNTETYPLGSMVTYEFPARTEAPQANNRHVQGLRAKWPAVSPCPPANYFGMTAACVRRVLPGCRNMPRWATTDGCWSAMTDSCWETQFSRKPAPKKSSTWPRKSRAQKAIMKNGWLLAKAASRLAQILIGPDR